MLEGLMDAWDETGCFVYQVVNSSIVVRSHPTVLSEDITRLEFDVNELVSVDLIEPSIDDENGPFVRLTDRTGWLFVKSRGVERLRRLDVERGLWAFYVDNIPYGQTVRRHPVESQDLSVEYNGRAVHLLPLQKIYCDARVTHPATGVNFYRIQGTTGWIFDRTSEASTCGGLGSPMGSSLSQEAKLQEGVGVGIGAGPGPKVMPPSPPSTMSPASSLEGPSTSTAGSSSDATSAAAAALLDRCMIIPEHKVQAGLFCFRALYTMVIRNIPSTSEESMTRHIVKAGEMVIVDIIRESPLEDDGGDGPFLRLTDGSGWLFQYKRDVKVMEQVMNMKQNGTWEVKVLNPPVGVGLRRHPIDSQTKMFKTVYPTDTLLQCDVKVTAHNGVSFYRVCGTTGWIFDKRGDSELLLELSANENDTTTCSEEGGDGGDGWTPDFVRGIASTVDRLEENQAWEGSKVLTFRLLNDVQVLEIDGDHEHHDDDGNNITQDASTTTTTLVTSSPSVSLCFHIYYESRTVGIYDEILQRQVCERDCSPKDLVRLFNLSVSELSDMLDSTSVAATAATPRSSVASKKMKNKNHQLRVQIGSFEKSPSDELGGLDFGEEKKQDSNDESADHDVVGDGTCSTGAETLHELQSSKDDALLASGFTNDMQEVELRTQLVRCEEALHNVRQQQVDILETLKEFDDKRAAEALKAKEMADERRREEDEADQKTVGGSSSVLGDRVPHSSTRSSNNRRYSSGSGSSRKVHRCGECRETFDNSEVRDEHCRDEHGIYCEHCNRAFKSFQRLEQHREDSDHW